MIVRLVSPRSAGLASRLETQERVAISAQRQSAGGSPSRSREASLFYEGLSLNDEVHTLYGR